jgi:hypothetical protein
MNKEGTGLRQSLFHLYAQPFADPKLGCQQS